MLESHKKQKGKYSFQDLGKQSVLVNITSQGGQITKESSFKKIEYGIVCSLTREIVFTTCTCHLFCAQN